MSALVSTSALPGAALRVGIVGGGFMATVHSRAARASGASLAGIVSSSPERSRAAAETLGIEAAYDSLDDLLANGAVDVVHVCTPNARHAEQAHAVLDAGIAVVCEKPLATTVGQARQLVDSAGDRVAAVPFVYRYHPLVREARARIASGEAGEILTIQGSYLQDWLLSSGDDNWRVDEVAGGRSRAFADIGSHLVDLVEFVTGDRITRVAAIKRTFFKERAQHAEVRTEDAVAVAVETASGAIGTLLVSQVAPGRKNGLRIEIAGSAETVAFDQEQPETLWLGRRSGSLLIPRDADQLHADAARLCSSPAGHPQGYQDAFDNFVADVYTSIRGEAPEGLPGFRDGLRAVEVTDAVITASETGSWADIQ